MRSLRLFLFRFRASREYRNAESGPRRALRRFCRTSRNRCYGLDFIVSRRQFLEFVHASLLVAASIDAPAGVVNNTVAPTRAAPEGSVTWPLIEPLWFCARHGRATSDKKKNSKMPLGLKSALALLGSIESSAFSYFRARRHCALRRLRHCSNSMASKYWMLAPELPACSKSSTPPKTVMAVLGNPLIPLVPTIITTSPFWNSASGAAGNLPTIVGGHSSTSALTARTSALARCWRGSRSPRSCRSARRWATLQTHGNYWAICGGNFRTVNRNSPSRSRAFSSPGRKP